MRIAIVGTGVSGMTAAWLLHKDNEIVVYEANDYIGGHSHTVEVVVNDVAYDVDTGFIVYNDRNYPLFNRLIDRLGVITQPTRMSFGVSCERTGWEYCGSSPNGLFAQRSNLLRPGFWRMIRDILRFNREAVHWLEHDADDTTTLDDFLFKGVYSDHFVQRYLIPMGAAIWSTDPDRFRQFPARAFIRFFRNHGLLALRDRPQWRVVSGGSINYVQPLTAPYADRIRLSEPVEAIRRFDDRVEVTSGRDTQSFDHVVVAAHSDQALAMLADPSDAEREILGAIRYQQNDEIVHTDAAVLPRNPRAWAAWNAYVPAGRAGRVVVTYNMNTLQSLNPRKPICVTLNRPMAVDQDEWLMSITYHHPLYTREAFAAQRRRDEICGVGRTHFCGAYWGYGFHEDGVRSAVDVARRFGKEL